MLTCAASFRWQTSHAIVSDTWARKTYVFSAVNTADIANELLLKGSWKTTNRLGFVPSNNDVWSS